MTESQLLFSYGTLRHPEIQRAVFGRLLETRPDRLTGYRLSTVRITDPEVVAVSGSDTHPILVASGDPADGVEGSALHVDEDDLLAADSYESADYQRARVVLESGARAWLYASAADRGVG